MAEKSRMHLAMERFEAALRGFESAVGHATEAGRRRQAMESEIRQLQDDRARLAEELDKVKVRASRLDEANNQVSVRLGAAMDNIKTILGSA